MADFLSLIFLVYVGQFCISLHFLLRKVITLPRPAPLTEVNNITLQGCLVHSNNKHTLGWFICLFSVHMVLYCVLLFESQTGHARTQTHR